MAERKHNMLCIDCGANITHSCRKTYQGEGSVCIDCADKRDNIGGGSQGNYSQAIMSQKKRKHLHLVRGKQ